MANYLYMVKHIERGTVICNQEALEHFLYIELECKLKETKSLYDSINEKIDDYTRAKMILWKTIIKNANDMEIQDIINELESLDYKIKVLTDRENFIKAYEMFE